MRSEKEETSWSTWAKRALVLVAVIGLVIVIKKGYENASARIHQWAMTPILNMPPRIVWPAPTQAITLPFIPPWKRNRAHCKYLEAMMERYGIWWASIWPEFVLDEWL